MRRMSNSRGIVARNDNRHIIADSIAIFLVITILASLVFLIVLLVNLVMVWRGVSLCITW